MIYLGLLDADFGLAAKTYPINAPIRVAAMFDSNFSNHSISPKKIALIPFTVCENNKLVQNSQKQN